MKNLLKVLRQHLKSSSQEKILEDKTKSKDLDIVSPDIEESQLPSIIRDDIVKCRKDHDCSFCGRKIKRGERAIYSERRIPRYDSVTER